jgi:hypothetical protein
MHIARKRARLEKKMKNNEVQKMKEKKSNSVRHTEGSTPEKKAC